MTRPALTLAAAMTTIMKMMTMAARSVAACSYDGAVGGGDHGGMTLTAMASIATVARMVTRMLMAMACWMK